MTAPSVVPGRPMPEQNELQRRIAVEVMGCVRVTPDGAYGAPPELIACGILPPDRGRIQLPRYAESMDGAWYVVERLREMRRGEAEMKQVFSLAHCYPADVVAQAICRAALLAVGGSGVPSSVVLAVDFSRSSPDAPAPAVAPPAVPSRDAGGADQ